MLKIILSQDSAPTADARACPAAELGSQACPPGQRQTEPCPAMGFSACASRRGLSLWGESLVGLFLPTSREYKGLRESPAAKEAVLASRRRSVHCTSPQDVHRQL
jgi:hypothetical protein